MKRHARPCDLRIPLLAVTVPSPRDYWPELEAKRKTLRAAGNDAVIGPAPKREGFVLPPSTQYRCPPTNLGLVLRFGPFRKP